MKENVFLVFGSDEFFVDLKAKKLLEAYEDYSKEVIDGTMTTIADMHRILSNVMEALRTMDFFSNKKCVWLRSTNLLSTGSPATTEGGQAMVEAWLKVIQNLPPDVYFLISASPVDKRMRLFKTLQGLASCEEMEDKKNEDYLLFLTQKLCREQHVEITREAVELLHQKMNYQPRAIANEIEKLACIKNFAGTIQLSDVMEATPTLLNDEFFEPVEAFYQKDRSRYIRSLRNHFTLNKEMRSVLSMMQNRNRLLIQLSELNLPNVSKNALDAQYKRYASVFGDIENKSNFCVFTQNPWYLSRLKIVFPLNELLELQKTFVDIFDLILKHPQQACSYMESLVRFF